MENVGTRLRSKMFEGKENFEKVHVVLEKIAELKALMSYTIVPSSQYYMEEEIPRFEEKWGGFKSVNRINFDICKGFHECLKDFDV